MTDEEIAAARAVIAKATPGPWTLDEGNRFKGAISATIDGMKRQLASADGQAAQYDMRFDADAVLVANAQFISAARAGWPAALTALEEARRGENQMCVERDMARRERDCSRDYQTAAYEAHRVVCDQLNRAEVTRNAAIARAEAAEKRVAELRRMIEGSNAPRFDCDECGPLVAVDEDGCCVTCGGDAQLHDPLEMKARAEERERIAKWHDEGDAREFSIGSLTAARVHRESAIFIRAAPKDPS